MTVFESLLNNTFTVSRRIRGSDGQGGWTIAYEDVGDIEGRLSTRNVGDRDRMVADSDERQITHTLYCLAGENIARGDIVSIDDLELEVLGIREPSLASEHWEIDCLERQVEMAEELSS